MSSNLLPPSVSQLEGWATDIRHAAGSIGAGPVAHASLTKLHKTADAMGLKAANMRLAMSGPPAAPPQISEPLGADDYIYPDPDILRVAAKNGIAPHQAAKMTMLQVIEMQPCVIRYVCGFYFTGDGRKVALIRKAHPEWQAGRLNGVGGRIENGETPVQAMKREFEEEAGITTFAQDWHMKLIHTGPGHVVYFFRHDRDPRHEGRLIFSHSQDEPVDVYHVSDLHALPVIPNLRWIVPLCLDDDLTFPVEVYDKSDPNRDGAAVREARSNTRRQEGG